MRILNIIRHITQLSSDKFYYTGIIVFILFTVFSKLTAQGFSSASDTSSNPENLRYPLRSSTTQPLSTPANPSPLLLKPPSNIKQTVEYNTESGQYEFSEKVGEIQYSAPYSLSIDEYRKYEANKSELNYWQQKSREESGAGPAFMKNLRLSNSSLGKVFDTDIINITPQGSAELIFGYSLSRNENPLLPVRNRRTGSFLFKQKIMMNVTGSIGDKVEVGLNFNTEATFDFENKTKLQYSGKEDEIVRKIEAGNVSFSLPGTLITGSQSLYGLRADLQFGRLTVSSVMSHQKGESSTINVQGGAQLTEFEIDVDEYDANRHFFLSHFFRDRYDKWLENLPYIESQVVIQQVEVWVVNKQNDFENARNIVAFMDLAESFGPDGDSNFMFYNYDVLAPFKRDSIADNALNNLYSALSSKSKIRTWGSVDDVVEEISKDFIKGRDYVSLESARLLSEREYTINRNLGYISLNSPLRNDEILGVSYTYTYKGQTYKVGELSTDVETPGTLILKLLKGTTSSPKYKNWDLMMKNVYAIGAFQVSQEKFMLNVLYRNDKTGVPVNYLSEPDKTAISDQVNEQVLLKVMDLDNLDSRNEPNPDGMFDFVEGITINSRNGRVYFPLLEPFGKDLRDKINDNDPNDIKKNRTADKYVFEELYDSTQTKAEQMSEKNKFVLKGQYQSSSSSEIQLNAMNVPKGSVKVTAGGIPLAEGQDYTVDYTLGRVKIINQGLLESGTPLQISLENNSLFNLQTKTLIGTHLDYKISENFNVGGTLMHLKETPLTKKVNMGDEPISNTIWGLNASYRTQSQLLTALIDKLPFLETKQASSIAFDGEFAQLIPGQAKVIGKNGVAYIDDFEAAQSKIELKSYASWNMASPPIDNEGLYFGTDNDSSKLEANYSRAKFAWYFIDPIFYSTSAKSPDNTAVLEDKDKNSARRINQKEIFKEKDNGVLGNDYISVLNVSYYPDERGPYNFDPLLGANNKLPNPESRWGGMMREIVNTDFETSNIEFIEFWLMDPYLDEDMLTNPGGDLYFHLGEISEDVLPDSRKSFEGGLPDDPNDTSRVDITAYGRVPKKLAYNNTFTTDNDKRKNQDVGLDGLGSQNEHNFYSQYLQTIKANGLDTANYDVSADNYEYYLGDNHDAEDHGIIDRYKNYNGPDGNSPIIDNTTTEDNSANKTSPDIEDINRDNTLNTTENYFQYHVSLKPNDLSDVGRNYIVDAVEVNDKDKNAKWYQFRIPISDFQDKVGEIEDFKSIRFMRMMMTGFKEPVVLRFATLDLVRAEWRRYDADISETGLATNKPGDDTGFEVSAVNIEENSEKYPVNYVLPPGIDRTTDATQTQTVELNEQSLLLKVKDLRDGDARAVFKNVQLDLRQYQKLQMFMHAESLPEEILVNDGDISAFIRIGSDYKNNYYEYEVPLKITPPGVQYADGSTAVWPTENEIKITLEDLVNLKIERNQAVEQDPLNYSTQGVYTIRKKIITDNGSTVITLRVKGNPNLSNIRQIILGVRNPGDNDVSENDGLQKSAEVWFNELRLTDFNNKGGWAANGRMQAQLADFGVVNVAGSTSKAGFGSIEEKVEERSHEELNQYDISSNLELGKFFSEKANVSIPLYFGLSRSLINPEYFPKAPDIKFEDVLAHADSKSERDSLKEISQDYTARNSLNFTNVRWNKQFKKFQVVSPSNFSGGINYSQTKAHNYNTEYNNLRRYGANFNYVYNARPKNIQPFNKSKSFKKPAYKIIRDFNFNPLPSRFTFATVVDRNYQEVKMRDVYDDVKLKIDSTINKDFRWDRKYDLKWDLTRALKLDYSATNSARIDEPVGGYDLFNPNNDEWKKEVRTSFYSGGRNMNFTQSFNANYTVPINKLPFLGWVNLTATYGGTYNWVRGEQLRDPSRILGNTLKNSSTIKLNSNLNFRSIYNKVAYLKNLETKQKNKTTAKKSADESNYKTVRFEKKTFFKKDQPRNIIHKLKTDNVEVKAYDVEGKELTIKVNIVDENKVEITSSEDIAGANVVVTGKIEKGQSPFVFVLDNSLRLLTGFKNGSVSWSRTSGTMLPGYLPETNYIGLSTASDAYLAPGFPFVFGWQDMNIARNSIDQNWITTETTFNKPLLFTSNESFNARLNYEPFKGFRVDLNAMRSFTQTAEQLFYYGYDQPNDTNHYYKGYFLDDIYNGGNFSISIISLSSTFEKVNNKNDWQSAAFEKMKTNRKVISARKYKEKFGSNVNEGNGDYFDGFGPTSQEVLVPAFLSAYTGTDPSKVTFTQFFWTMMPNWRITFDGLSEVPTFKKFLKNITLNHSYKSTYSVGSYGTNVGYFSNNESWIYDDLKGYMRDQQNNILAEYQFDGVSISEQLSPLIGVDMTWNNSLITKFEIAKSRMIALSLSSNQINETHNNDITVGAGYRFKEVPFHITAGGSTKQIKSDLNVRFDLTVRDNVSIIRFLSEELENQLPEVTTGTRKLSFSFTADYVVSEKFNIQFFFDRTINKPHTSRSFLTAETNVGFSLRLSL